MSKALQRERSYNAAKPGPYQDTSGRLMLGGVQIGDSVDRSDPVFYLAAKRFQEVLKLLSYRLQEAGEIPGLSDVIQLTIALKLIRGRLQYADLISVCQLHFPDVLMRDAELPSDWWPIIRPALDDRFHVFSAEEAGNALSLSAEERAHLKIKTIRAAGMTDEMQAAQRRASRIEAQKRRRREKGVRAKEEIERNSVSALAREMGISRATAYRKMKRETLVKPIGSEATSVGFTSVSHAEPTQKGKTR